MCAATIRLALTPRHAFDPRAVPKGGSLCAIFMKLRLHVQIRYTDAIAERRAGTPVVVSISGKMSDDVFRAGTADGLE